MDTGEPAPEPEEPGVQEIVQNYFSDPARVRQADVHDFIDYISNRAIATSTMGGVLGLGQGYSSGGMAINIGATGAFRWGAGGCLFFGTAYALRAAREREDALNYTVSGAVNYGIYRALRLGPRGALTGAVMGAVGGTMYKFCAEELYDGLRAMWLNKRRFLLSDNPPVTVTRTKINPFPPQGPSSSTPNSSGK